MSGRDPTEIELVSEGEIADGAELLRPLVQGKVSAQNTAPEGIVIGELLAIKDEGRTPLVTYAGQPGTAALAARTVVDLHGAHIGCQLVMMFEGGDVTRPIVMGVVRSDAGTALEHPSGQVEVDADGERMIVAAREQLVLRCGKASITLTKAGKVLIQGEYVLSRSSGVNRVKGGSVQLN